MRARWIRFAAVGVVLTLPLACGDDDDDDAAPAAPTNTTVAVEGASINASAPETSPAGQPVLLAVTVEGLDLVKADGDTSGRTGHFHVFIDRDPVPEGAAIPREAGIVHTTDDPITLTGLPVGTHRLVVVYGNGAHARIGTAQAETNVKVEGPSVKATAPATARAGEPLNVSMTVEGFSLVKADGDTSGRTGHLHLFVDRPPTPPGQPIPAGDPKIIHTAETTAAINDLTPGEHTIWVVAGDGTHMPLSAGVMDKVTVTVT